MRQTRTRILSLLLALVMCLSLLPVTAMAAGSGEPSLFLDSSPGYGTVPVDFLEYTILDGPGSGSHGTLYPITPGETVNPPSGTEENQHPSSCTLTIELTRLNGERHVNEYSYDYNYFISFRPANDLVNLRFVSGTGSATSLSFNLTENSTIRLEASYSDKTFGITYNYNGAAEGTVTTKAKNGSAINLPNPSLPGYRFLGWYTGTPRGQYLTNYSRFTEGIVKGDMTLYAMWEKDSSAPSSYTITFDPNGGTVSPATRQTDSEGRVPGGYPTPTREGYTFLGWFTDGDGYKPTDNEIWGGNQTLIAKWEKAAEAARVTFYPNGGRITEFKGVAVPEKNPNPGPFYIDENGVTGVDMNSGWGWTSTEKNGLVSEADLPKVERSGYAFDGWYIVSGPQANQAGDGKLTDFTGLSQLGTAPFYPQGVELAAKWTASQTYTVAFDLNGMPGTTPEPQKVAKGGTVELPEVAVPDQGITYHGWCFLGEDDYLHIWKADTVVTDAVTLYAGWEPKKIAGEDTFQFSNSGEAFNSYRISDTYFNYLAAGEPTTYRERLSQESIQSWNGSCFGLSAVYCMGRAGKIGLSTFQSGASRLWDLQQPNSSQNIQDLINFYMLSQFTSAINDYRLNFYVVDTATYAERTVADRYQMIVNGIESKPNFTLLAFNFIDNFGQLSGHAIVARGVSKGSDGQYHIEIWDPNFPSALGELIVSSDYQRAWFGGKTMNSGEYNTNLELRYIMPISEKSQHYDAKNLETVFGKGATTSSQASTPNIFLLSSSVGDFSVAADGRTAVVKNGKKVSGDLPLLSNPAMTGTSDGYSFIIGANTLDGLTITVGGKQAKVEFVSNDILARVSAGSLNSMEVRGDTVTTSCASQAQQEITVVSDDLGSTWNKVTVSGKDTGITLSAKSGQLQVSSKSNTSLMIQGENVDSRKTSSKQTVTASSSGTTVSMSSLGTGAQQPAGDNPFTDVKAGAYYYDAVLWAVEKKVTSGTSATTFSPDSSCTRGQIVTFLWRAAGSPKPASNNNPFTDVKAGAYYYDAVLWAVEKGITSGTSAATFSPDASCTRGQTVTFLHRAAGSPKAVSSANPFTDVKAGTYYYDAVLWAVANKITSGTSATTFAPGSTVTRGQTVTFLYRSQDK